FAGDTVIAKSFTVTFTVVLCVSTPCVAVIVTVYVPPVCAVNASVDMLGVAPSVTECGAMVVVRPRLGLVVVDKLTVPVSPCSGVIVTAVEVDAPARSGPLNAPAEIEKSGSGDGGGVRGPEADAVNAAAVFGVPRPVGPS